MYRSTTVRWLMIGLGIVLAARGVVSLAAPDSTTGWTELLGIGGFADAEARFGAIGVAMRVLALIESRLWIILAFALIFRLPWGRDVILVVAAGSVLVQGCRLLLGAGLGAAVWLGLFVGLIGIFITVPQLKAYLAVEKG
jgi:hypothetical protein